MAFGDVKLNFVVWTSWVFELPVVIVMVGDVVTVGGNRSNVFWPVTGEDVTGE